MKKPYPHDSNPSRRRFMRNIAGTGIAALVSGYATAAEIAAQESANICLFTPAAVEGPYYINSALLRSDVREDRTGTDLHLRLHVVDTDRGCAPISNATVDIWHCDANGYYSGYPDGDPNAKPGDPGGPPEGLTLSRRAAILRSHRTAAHHLAHSAATCT